MKTFPRPQNLNGAELKEQLAEIGIIVTDIYDYANGTIGFETDDESAALLVVKGHNGSIVPKEPTVAEKLASVGLNLDDLKAALGL